MLEWNGGFLGFNSYKVLLLVVLIVAAVIADKEADSLVGRLSLSQFLPIILFY